MKRPIILFVFTSLLSLHGFPQEHRGFQASVSTVTRLAPTLMGGNTPSGRTSPLMVNVTEQLNGPGLNLNLGFLFRSPNILISIGNTLRYDIVGYMKIYMEPKPEARAFWAPIWHPIADLDFNLTKYFTIGKTEPYLTIGAALMNRNCDYRIPDSVALSSPPASAHVTYTAGDFYFPALKTGIGFRYRQMIVEFNILWTHQDVYEFRENLLLPEIRLGYSITK